MKAVKYIQYITNKMSQSRKITYEELSEFEEHYDVEFNGMSGLHYGYEWYTATKGNEVIELYVENLEL